MNTQKKYVSVEEFYLQQEQIIYQYAAIKISYTPLIQSNTDIIYIKQSQFAFEYLKKLFEDDIYVRELFWIVVMNGANQVLGIYKLSEGGISATMVDIRLLAFVCINLLGTNIIICHNHPSGTLKPSKQDLNITEQIKKVLELLGMNLTDHLIITANGYYSMAENGDI